MADQEEFLPDGWIKSFSKRFNKHYYFNSQTNESIWENPFQNNNEVKSACKNIPELGSDSTKCSHTKENSYIKTAPLCAAELKKLVKKDDGVCPKAHINLKIKDWANNVESVHKNNANSNLLKKCLPIIKPVESCIPNNFDKGTLSSKYLNTRKRSACDFPISSTLLPLESNSSKNELFKAPSKAKSVCSEHSFDSDITTNRTTVHTGDISVSSTAKHSSISNTNLTKKIIPEKTSIKNSSSLLKVEKLTPAMKNCLEKKSVETFDQNIVPRSRYVSYKKAAINKTSIFSSKDITKVKESVLAQSSAKDIREKLLPTLKPLKVGTHIPKKSKLIDSASIVDKSLDSVNPFFDQKLSNRTNYIDIKPSKNGTTISAEVSSPSVITQPMTSIFTTKILQEDFNEPMQFESDIVFDEPEFVGSDSDKQDHQLMRNQILSESTNFSPSNSNLSIQRNSSEELNSLKPEEDMEIDDASNYKEKILKEIREIREERIVQKPQATDHDSALLPTYTDPLYIVVDTNILLGHLKFVSELKDYQFPGVGAPILIIPWMVLQELDSLKDAVNRTHTETNEDGVEVKSTKLNILARQAIKFISKCLEGGHPRLKGESVIEASLAVEGFNEVSNDDSIIHCALALKKRANHSHIVVLSNDRNLCNKSIIVGLKAFSQPAVIFGLRSLFQDGTVAIKKENYEEFYEEFKIQETISRRKKQADEISCELQCILREAFAKIIETEMKKAYEDNLWLKIIKIQPPWTLNDAFVLLERHWIAVFGMIVQRSLEKKITHLKQLFQACEGKAGDLDSVQQLLNESLLIFEAFSNYSDYDEMLTNAISAVRVLITKCSDIIRREYPIHQLPFASHISKISDENVSLPVKCKEGFTRSEEFGSTPNLSVMQTFEALWVTVKRFSALIFYSLDYPNPLLKELDPNEPKPSRKEALECLSTLTSCLSRLVITIQSILLVDAERLPSSDVVSNLLQALSHFMIKVMKKPCSLKAEDLLQFCLGANTRTVLVQGLSQLDHSYAMLQQCVDYTNG